MAVLTTAFLITTAIQIGASIALGFVAKALRKKPKVDTDSLDFEQTVQRRLRNGQPLEVLVGKRITAGIGVFDDGYGTKNEFGVSVTVLSAKPCTDFHGLFVDGEPVTLQGDPTITEATVTSHFLGKQNTPRIKVRLFLGHDNSGLGSYLQSKGGKFLPADMGGQYCVLVTQCQNTNDDFDEESGENYIPFQGYPEFKVELSGVKVCDPRLGFAYDDVANYVYSDNAALIDAQYDYGWYDGEGNGHALIVGNGYPAGLMEIDRIKSNADYCDNEGFTCAGIIRSGSADQEEIWKCYNADRVEHPAKIYSVPEGNRTISETIDLSRFPAAHISEYDEDGYSTEVYNEIQTVYAEPKEFYGEKDLPIYNQPEWIAADNHIPRQMSLPLLYVTNQIQAHKLEKQEIYISRTPATCTISDLPFGFIRIGVGDVITVTGCAVAAINDRQWIVKGKGQSPMGDVSLILRAFAEAEAFNYEFDPNVDFPLIVPNIPLPRFWPWWGNQPYVNPGVVSGLNTAVGTINSEVTGIIDGTRELGGLLIAGRGPLIPEIEGIGGNVDGILNGTAELADINLANRALTLANELDGLDSTVFHATNGVGATFAEVQGIIGGTRELNGVLIAGRGPLIPEIEGIGGNVDSILNGTAELADINLANRALTLSNELNGVNSNIQGLDSTVNHATSGVGATFSEVQAIIGGTRELADINLANRSLTLSNELDDVAGTITNLDTDVTGIKDGTLTLTDVNIDGIGSLLNKDAAQDANISNATTSGGGSLSVTVSPNYAFASTSNSAQTITTNTITLSVNNGSGSETINYVKVSGDTVNVDSQSAITTSFSGVPGPAGIHAVYKAIVTDSGNTAEVQISISLNYFDPNNSN